MWYYPHLSNSYRSHHQLENQWVDQFTRRLNLPRSPLYFCNSYPVGGVHSANYRDVNFNRKSVRSCRDQTSNHVWLRDSVVNDFRSFIKHVRGLALGRLTSPMSADVFTTCIVFLTPTTGSVCFWSSVIHYVYLTCLCRSVARCTRNAVKK